MRVVIAPDSFGGTLGAEAAAAAIAEGWRRAAPGDDLVLLPVADGGTGVDGGAHTPSDSGPAGLDGALDGAGIAVTGGASFDWRSLRGTPVTAVARSAAARGVPCLVLAGQVSVGRREAAAVGVDAAYAVADDAGGAAGPPADPTRASAADPAGALAALAEKVARRWSR